MPRPEMFKPEGEVNFVNREAATAEAPLQVTPEEVRVDRDAKTAESSSESVVERAPAVVLPKEPKPDFPGAPEYDIDGVAKPLTDKERNYWKHSMDKRTRIEPGATYEQGKYRSREAEDRKLAEEVGEGIEAPKLERPMILTKKQMESYRNAYRILEKEFDEQLQASSGEITPEMAQMVQQTYRMDLRMKKLIEVDNPAEARNLKKAFDYFDTHASLEAKNYTDLVEDVANEMADMDVFDREEARLRQEYEDFAKEVGPILEAGDAKPMKLPSFEELQQLEDKGVLTGSKGEEGDSYSRAAKYIDWAVKYDVLRAPIVDRFENLASIIGDFGRAKTKAETWLGVKRNMNEVKQSNLEEITSDTNPDIQAAK